jgi:hypothetical protein
MAYSIQEFDIIHNQKCHFYKLLIDGKCQFDEFVSNAEKIATNKKCLANIYSRMDSFDPDQKLPKEKFNHIEGGKYDRKDVYEFKKDQVRVYVILIKPNIYVICGAVKKGKKDQQIDIKHLFKAVNAFDEKDINIVSIPK